MAALAMTEAGERGRGEEPEPEEGAQAVDHRRLLRSQYLAVKSLISDEKNAMASVDSDKFRAIISKVEGLHQLAIRKLCRNRGLVSQDEPVATSAQGAMQNNVLAMGGSKGIEDELVAASGAEEVVEDKMLATGVKTVMGDKVVVKERKEILMYKRRRLFQDVPDA